TEYYQQQLNVFIELLSYIWIYPDTKEGVRGLITYRESKLPLDILYLIKQEIKEEVKRLHNHLVNLHKDRNNLLFIRNIRRGQLPFDRACYICHPASENPSDQFKRFYQWISQEYK
ncbi:4520_t:CDS:2, partial [Funneliformis geosporum]